MSTISAVAPQHANFEHEVDAMMVSLADIQKPVTGANVPEKANTSENVSTPEKTSAPHGTAARAQGAAAAQTKQAGAGKPSPAGQRKLKIRAKRLALALTGLVALIAVPVTMLTSVFSLTSWLVPVCAFAVVFLAVVGLRTMARRDQARRRATAFEEKARLAAGRPVAASAETKSGQGSAVNTKVAAPFDAQDASSAKAASNTDHDVRSGKVNTRTQAAAVVTRDQLRAMALDQVRVTEGKATAVIAKTSATWEPVSVPRPTYTEAPKVARAQVAPVEIPEQPKPEGKVNIGREQAAKRAAIAETAVEATRESATSEPAKTSQGAPQDGKQETSTTRQPTTGQLNLDDVLQRRRA